MAESEYEGHPLLERLKFVSIFSTNLDEFFMIRVAGLKRQIQAGVVELSRDGMTPEEQFVEIRKRLLKLYARQEEILLKELLPELEKNDIHFHEIINLTKKIIMIGEFHFRFEFRFECFAHVGAVRDSEGVFRSSHLESPKFAPSEFEKV